MNAQVPITDHYRSQFANVKQRLPGHGVAWLEHKRNAALECFAATGFPTPRSENWKYTNVRPIARQTFQVAGETCLGLVEEDLGAALIGGCETHRVVFVNGRYTPQLSSTGVPTEGVTIGSMARLLTEKPEILAPFLTHYADMEASGFTALNTALMGDGAFIELAEGVKLETPIQLIYASTALGEPTAFHLRNLILARENSLGTVIETYVSLGEAKYLNNVVTEMLLQSNATLDHYKLQQESIQGFHIATLQAQQERDSRLTSHSVSFGGALVRNDINTVLNAEGAECNLNGLYVVSGKQHVDFHTRIDHKKPHGVSREHYTGVVGGRARAVFNGCAYVHPNAQKTDAQQYNKNMLLSPHAEVDTKPQLEIYADDVKCSHGATVGQLDEQMLFYMRSRGIAEADAREMLTYGFARDVVERMNSAPVRAHVETQLKTKLETVQQLSKPNRS